MEQNTARSTGQLVAYSNEFGFSEIARPCEWASVYSLNFGSEVYDGVLYAYHNFAHIADSPEESEYYYRNIVELYDVMGIDRGMMFSSNSLVIVIHACCYLSHRERCGARIRQYLKKIIELCKILKENYDTEVSSCVYDDVIITSCDFGCEEMDIERRLDYLKEATEAYETAKTLNVELDLDIYRRMIVVYSFLSQNAKDQAEMLKYSKQVLQIYTTVARIGFLGIHYCSVMDSYMKLGRYDKVLDVYRMAKSDEKLDVYICGRAIFACKKLSEFGKSAKILAGTLANEIANITDGLAIFLKEEPTLIKSVIEVQTDRLLQCLDYELASLQRAPWTNLVSPRRPVNHTFQKAMSTLQSCL